MAIKFRIIAPQDQSFQRASHICYMYVFLVATGNRIGCVNRVTISSMYYKRFEEFKLCFVMKVPLFWLLIWWNCLWNKRIFIVGIIVFYDIINYCMRNRLYILINIERVSKHAVTIRGLRVVTTCWSWAWSNRTSPSKWVRLGSPLAACWVYGDLTCSVHVHTVNNLCMFNCQCRFYLYNRGPYVRLAFVPNMLFSWNKDIIISSSIAPPLN